MMVGGRPRSLVLTADVVRVDSFVHSDAAVLASSILTYEGTEAWLSAVHIVDFLIEAHPLICKSGLKLQPPSR